MLLIQIDTIFTIIVTIIIVLLIVLCLILRSRQDPSDMTMEEWFNKETHIILTAKDKEQYLKDAFKKAKTRNHKRAIALIRKNTMKERLLNKEQELKKNIELRKKNIDNI